MGPPRPADPHVCRPYRAAAERRRESVDPPVPGDPPDAAARAAAGGGPADPDPWDAGPGDHTHLRWVPGAARPRLSAPAGVLAAAGAAGVLLGRAAEGAAPAGPRSGVQGFRRSGVQDRQSHRPSRSRRPERLNARPEGTRPERLSILAREPLVAGTFPKEIVTCRLDGSELRLLCKYDASHG